MSVIKWLGREGPQLDGSPVASTTTCLKSLKKIRATPGCVAPKCSIIKDTGVCTPFGSTAVNAPSETRSAKLGPRNQQKSRSKCRIYLVVTSLVGLFRAER
jgi:hypothetical protein